MRIFDSSGVRGQDCDLGSVTHATQGRFGSGPQQMAAWEGTDLLLRLMVERCKGGDSGIFPCLRVLSVFGTEYWCSGFSLGTLIVSGWALFLDI